MTDGGPLRYIEDVWRSNRSLVTDDYDDAVEQLAIHVDGDLTVQKFESGTDAWTWRIPKKWSVSDAYIEANGERLLDYDHPLRVVTYSDSIDEVVSREELFDHLHWDQSYELNGVHMPANPDAIPYVFKFYTEDWGFCLRQTELDRFEGHQKFRVRIDTKFEPGYLKTAEYTAEGKTDETVLLQAHLDHPAQVNDGLSGVAVGAEVIDHLRNLDTRYTYKLLVAPETIGSIAYFSRNEDRIGNLRCSIFLEMLGTEGPFNLQRSYPGDAEIDKLAEYILCTQETEFSKGPFREVIGNDEMVTNGPGVRVPTISLSRWPYDEYHTSLDTPEIITEDDLVKSTRTVLAICDALESNRTPRRQFKGPVFLSRYDLWEEWGGWGKQRKCFETLLMELEGEKTALEIAEHTGVSYNTVCDFLETFESHNLVDFE